MKRDDYGSDTTWNMSIDYGSRNAWSANFWALTPNGEHHHFKEIYRTRLILDELIARIRKVREDFKITQISNVFSDHDAEHNDRMMLEGFPISLADKDVLPGIELVKEQLENGNIKFNTLSMTYHRDNNNRPEGPDEHLFGHPKCLRDELGVYAYRTEGKRTFTEKDEYPIDYGNHSMDSMRYYIKGMDNINTYFPISASYSMGAGSHV